MSVKLQFSSVGYQTMTSHRSIGQTPGLVHVLWLLQKLLQKSAICQFNLLLHTGGMCTLK